MPSKPKTTTTTPKKPAAPRKRKLSPVTDAAPAPTAEQIRMRAYFLSLERNGGGGDPVADWIRAERELTASAPAEA